jgi:hypothetical protein
MGLDPVTAGLNAICAFFTFAATPTGQKILEDIRAVNQKVATDIAALIEHIGASQTGK